MTEGDRRPIPDPTGLTTDALETQKDDLRREIGAQKELVDAQLAALELRVTEGDGRLASHIVQQYGQLEANLEAAQREVQLALDAAEKLELNRIQHVEQRIEGVRREVTLIQQAASEAVKKAEHATDKRLEEVRRSSDIQFTELRRALTELNHKVGKVID